MSVELVVLGLSALLWAAVLAVAAVGANRQLGLEYHLGPRDEQRQLTGRVGRLQRALNNHIEGLVLFTVAVVVVELRGAGSGFTAVCAVVYLLARVLYVPAYAFAWTPWRSLIWKVGFLATLAMLLVGVFG